MRFPKVPKGANMFSFCVVLCVFVPLEVLSCRFWMMHYGHACPKRTVLFSNNPRVMMFSTGKLSVRERKKLQAKRGSVRTVTKKVNSKGQVTYTGTSALKGTQP